MGLHGAVTPQVARVVHNAIFPVCTCGYIIVRMSIDGRLLTQKHSMRFSVVIPTKNRVYQLTTLIRELQAQRYSSSDFEIIVVNNDAKIDIASILDPITNDATTIRVVTMKTSGPSYARNYGYSLARYKHVIFLDDDVRVSPKFLSAYALAWQQHPNAAIIGGRIIPDKNIYGNTPEVREKRRLLIKKYNWIYASVDYGNKSMRLAINDLLCSAALCVNKKTMPSNKPLFNTLFGATHMGILTFSEDFELCNRIMLKGKEVWYAANVIVVHQFGKNRFTPLYIIKRHILAGAENFLMNISLTRTHPSFLSLTLAHRLWISIKKLMRGVDDYYLHQFKDPLFIIFFVSYFTLGPILYALAHSASSTKRPTFIE